MERLESRTPPASFTLSLIAPLFDLGVSADFDFNFTDETVHSYIEISAIRFDTPSGPEPTFHRITSLEGNYSNLDPAVEVDLNDFSAHIDATITDGDLDALVSQNVLDQLTGDIKIIADDVLGSARALDGASFDLTINNDVLIAPLEGNSSPGSVAPTPEIQDLSIRRFLASAQ